MKPSSWMSLESLERTRPPTSGEWAQHAAKPTRRRRRKIGATMV